MGHGNPGTQSGWKFSLGISAVLGKGAPLGSETAKESSKLSTSTLEKPLPFDVPSRQRVLKRKVI